MVEQSQNRPLNEEISKEPVLKIWNMGGNFKTYYMTIYFEDLFMLNEKNITNNT